MLITICNYNIYQDSKNYEGNSEENAKGTPKEQREERQGNNINNNDLKNDKNKKNSPKQVYDETSLFYQLAMYFVEQIRLNNPDFKQPNMQKWSDDIRKMVELDNRAEEQIRYLMKWVQQDDFEMANVLSPAKLRQRFDQLIIKVKRENNKRPLNRHKKTPEQIEQEKLVEQIRRGLQK